MPKRAEAALDNEFEPSTLQSSASKKRSPKKSKFTGPFVDRLGWTVVPPSLIYRDFGDVQATAKVAAFNLESTLVNRKSSSMYPRDAADWRWWNPSTPARLASLVQEGYKLVIFTNQSMIQGGLEGKGKEKVEEMLQYMYNNLQAQAGEGVNMSLQCFIAPSKLEDDPCRKPATGMWDYMVQYCSYGVTPDLTASFYVGDGSGTAPDHSDRQFAAAVGIPYKTPEEVFGPVEGKMVIGREVVKAAKQGVASGDNPNAELVMLLRQLGERLTAGFKARTVGGKANFKGNAIKNASEALSTFPEEVHEANLRAVSALRGVGPGTMKRIKAYLATGSVILPDEEEEAEVLALIAASGR